MLCRKGCFATGLSLHFCVVLILFYFFGELCGQMPESKTPVVDKKRPVNEVDSEIVKLRALLRQAFNIGLKGSRVSIWLGVYQS